MTEDEHVPMHGMMARVTERPRTLAEGDEATVHWVCISEVRQVRDDGAQGCTLYFRRAGDRLSVRERAEQVLKALY